MDAADTRDLPRSVALVLGGGIGLGAFEAGACSALLARPGLRVDWVAGSSIGAVTAAIVAGNAPEQVTARLHAFWAAVAELAVPASPWFAAPSTGLWRQWLNERSALMTVLLGRPGLFRPRLSFGRRVGVSDVPALFDLAPLTDTLSQLIDFDRLNAGPIRVTLCSTDVIGGDRVVFDTARGDRIGMGHVVASSALLPLFAPVEIDGRLLADGALSANTPVDEVLYEDDSDMDRLCFVMELFAAPGQRPHTLAAAANRATELVFGNQTKRTLEDWHRRERLRATIGKLAAHLPEAVRNDPAVAEIVAHGRPARTELRMIAYRGGLDEAGLFKSFDFSRATLDDRWQAGVAAATEALAAPAAEQSTGSRSPASRSAGG